MRFTVILRREILTTSWRKHQERTPCRDTDQASKVQNVDRGPPARLPERRLPRTIDNPLPFSRQPRPFDLRGLLLEPILSIRRHAHLARHRERGVPLANGGSSRTAPELQDRLTATKSVLEWAASLRRSHPIRLCFAALPTVRQAAC